MKFRTTVMPFAEPELIEDPIELIELVEALSYNKSLTIENRHVIMHNLVRPMIQKGWEKCFKKNTAVLYRLVLAVFELDYYYSPIIFKALMILIDHPKFLNLNKLDMIYKILLQIDEDKKDFMDVGEMIKQMEDKLRSRDAYRWRYNVDERRFYTYKEMKAKREDVDLSSCEHFFEGLLPCAEDDKEVWHEHWVHLVMKRDMSKYMKKMRDLDVKKVSYEIDFDNFNPVRWNDNIKLLVERKSDDMDFLDDSEEAEHQNTFPQFSDDEE